MEFRNELRGLSPRNLSRTWEAEAARLARVARERFWDAERGGFLFSTERRVWCTEANPLALAFGFATEAEAESIIARHPRHKL